MHKHHVTFDRQLTMIAVTDSTFSGLARQLDPAFEFFAFMVKGITRLVFAKKALPATAPARGYEALPTSQPALGEVRGAYRDEATPSSISRSGSARAPQNQGACPRHPRTS